VDNFGVDKVVGTVQTHDVPDRPLTTSDVADLFRVTNETVTTWADAGKLAHFKTPGGHYRFRREDVEAFLRPVNPTAEAAS
jgi:excisionase family DNA binding protein